MMDLSPLRGEKERKQNTWEARAVASRPEPHH
jgi:hypothetical protein